MTKTLAALAFGLLVVLAALTLGVTATAAGAKTDPADKALAKVGVFRASDFPAGWSATPQDKDDFSDCPAVEKAVKAAKVTKTADVDGSDFGRGNDEYSSGVVVLRTVSEARRTLGIFGSRVFRRCMRDLADEIKDKVEDEDVDDVKVEVGTLTGVDHYGDGSSGTRFTITATKGLTVSFYADVVMARVGRAVGLYGRVSTDESLTCSEYDDDCADFDGLITTATERLAAEQST